MPPNRNGYLKNTRMYICKIALISSFFPCLSTSIIAQTIKMIKIFSLIEIFLNIRKRKRCYLCCFYRTSLHVCHSHTHKVQ
jgi:hypothetical protein